MDGSIRIGTKLDLSGLKAEIKELEKELKNAQKEADKLTAKEEKTKESFSAEREVDAEFDTRFSHRDEIDKREAEALSKVTAQREELNQKTQEYSARLDEANAKMQEQIAIANAAKDLSLATKNSAILDKITTQEQYNTMLQQTQAKMELIEAKAREIADATGVNYEKLLACSAEYARLCEILKMLETTTIETGNESEKAGEKSKEGFKKARKEADKLGNSIKKGIKTLARMSLAVLGVRGAYSLVRKAVNACLSSNEELSNKISAIWSTLGTIMEPVVESMVNAIYKILAYINYFVKVLTGIDFVANANAKAISKQAAATDKLTKSTKAANKALASFDEMNVMNDPSTAGASLGGSAATLDLPELTEEEMSNIDGIVEIIEIIRIKTDELKVTIGGLVGWWQELDTWTQILIVSLGVGGLAGILTGKGSVAAAIIAVGGALAGLNALIFGDTADALDGWTIMLGVGGLVGVLIGGMTGLTVAGSIIAVSTIIAGFNILLNGDTSEAILGVIFLLGGAGLAGYLWGGVKGIAVGIALASLMSLLNGFNKLLSGDTEDAIEGVIQILIGTTGLVFAFNMFINIIKGESGVSAVLIALKSPLFLCVAGFAVLAAGILYLCKNWDKMSGAQKAITILSALAAAAAAAAIAIAIFHTSWTVGVAAAAIAGGVALLGLTFAFSGASDSEMATSGQQMAANFYADSNFTGNPLPKLAVGGIVNNPGKGVHAIIGEAGAEAVLPLENNTEWMDILAEKIGGNVTIPIYMDGKKIATYVVDIQKKRAFAMNGA